MKISPGRITELSIILIYCVSTFSDSVLSKALDYDSQLAAQLAMMNKNSHYAGNFNNDDKVSAASDKLDELILKFATHADFFASPLKKSQANGLAVAKSVDSNLRVFSWDNLAGGTAHSFNTVFQFKSKAGKLFGVDKPQGEEGDLGAYYTSVKSVQTSSGEMLYVIVGDTIGSSIDQGTNITAYTIKSDRLEQTKAFKFKAKMLSSIDCWTEGAEDGQKEIKFLDQNKTIKIPLTNADRRCTGKYLIYKFDGTNYVYGGNGK